MELTLGFTKTKMSILFGGGCETEVLKGNTNLTDLNNSLSKRGWSVDLLERKKSTKDELLKSIDRILNLPAKDQPEELYLGIQTHGAPENISDGRPHRICVFSEKTNKEEDLNINDPDLISRLKKVKERNIKLAISDASCWGGASINELSDYGCIVSNQSANRVSWGGGIMNSIIRLEQKSNQPFSMQDVWLDTLVNDDAAALGYILQPEISGDKTGLELGGPLTRALISPEKSTDDQDQWQDEDYDCERHQAVDQNIEKLKSQMNAIDHFVHNSFLNNKLKELTGHSNELTQDKLKLLVKKQLLEYQDKIKKYHSNLPLIEKEDEQLNEIKIELDLSDLLTDNLSENMRKEILDNLKITVGLDLTESEKNPHSKIYSTNGNSLAQAIHSIKSKQKGEESFFWSSNKIKKMSHQILEKLGKVIKKVDLKTLEKINKLYDHKAALEEEVNFSVEARQEPTYLTEQDKEDGKLIPSSVLRKNLNENISKLRFYLYLKQKATNPKINKCDDFNF